ncbi:MAG: VWA domain-containing protein [Myxococcaceae bacterium]|nr:VWA domain-containing protein [Myxococcaceae bacterium]
MTRLVLPLVVVLATSCAALRPRLVDASVQKPSNVAVYFTVDTRQGDPVPGLTADQFRIYEDDKLVSKFESKQTILNPEVAAMHYLLLLVDLSASVTQSGSGEALEAAVASFTDRVGQYQQTAIFGFDGRPELIPIRGFAPGRAGSSGLASMKPRDPSTNLNGAIVEAVKVLEKQLDKSPVPLRFGTLVVFTDGTDQAHRAAARDVEAALDRSSFDVFVIGVGAEIDERELRAIGRSGAALSRDPRTLSASFEQVAARIEGFSKRFYLLSYCSPARAGVHELRIEPVTSDGKSGALTYPFDAQGFGPDCDPNRKPAFDLKRPRQPR